jgi:hypothetical protein
MPRLFDYAGSTFRCQTVFPLIEDQEPKGSEIALEAMWPEGSLNFPGGRIHQFELDAGAGVNPYRNELVDPVYDWMVENVRGPFQWLEMETNHGHSTQTFVWIEDPEEHGAFLDAWSDRFKVRESQLAKDIAVRQDWLDHRAAEAGSPAP